MGVSSLVVLGTLWLWAASAARLTKGIALAVAAVNLACAAASLAFALAPSCAEDGTLAGGAWAVAGMLLARAVAALACALAFDGMLLAGVVTAMAFAGTVLAIALGVRTCPTIFSLISVQLMMGASFVSLPW